ncbi:hypothetical protein [Luteibacter sp.]|jgi:hypothetical protein|uniref:hypothetical protein n=1 Tax=Luteibacter sp. TaxID=1886636 RepID=UPI002F3F2F94
MSQSKPFISDIENIRKRARECVLRYEYHYYMAPGIQEEHAEDMATLLENLGAKGEPAAPPAHPAG